MVRLVAGGLEDRSKDPDLKAGVRPVDPPEDRELTGVTAAADDDDDSIYRGNSTGIFLYTFEKNSRRKKTKFFGLRPKTQAPFFQKP